MKIQVLGQMEIWQPAGGNYGGRQRALLGGLLSAAGNRPMRLPAEQGVQERSISYLDFLECL
ncbi:hypothetical protein [Variovorax gossypii]